MTVTHIEGAAQRCSACSLGVLLEDILIVITALVVGVAGVALEIVLGSAAIHGIASLF
jgi:hypothetical protein